jgi:hypothetical protein
MTSLFEYTGACVGDVQNSRYFDRLGVRTRSILFLFTLPLMSSCSLVCCVLGGEHFRGQGGMWWGGSHPYQGVLVWSEQLNRWHGPRDKQSSILSQSCSSGRFPPLCCCCPRAPTPLQYTPIRRTLMGCTPIRSTMGGKLGLVS